MNGDYEECFNSLHTYESAIITSKQPVDIQFRELTYSVQLSKGNWKEILHSVTGDFRSGRLTGILGPSGSGKTSLLNVISGRIPRNKTCCRGVIMSSNESTDGFRSLTCYIPQVFDMMPLLTVQETLYIAARLKLPKNSEATRNCTIQTVASNLGLTECMETLTECLSGGEKKRLSIAVEAITSPLIMLLDEPTSGLDSASSNQVINLLNSLSKTGCTVVCTVHQPSSQITDKFDDFLILSKGVCRYCGPRDQMFNFFKSVGFTCPSFYNIAEFVLEVVTGQRGGNYDSLRNSAFHGSISKVTNYPLIEENDRKAKFISDRKYAVSRWEQQKILLYRSFICISRDSTLTKLRLAAHISVAILLGLVFYDFGQDASKTTSNIACLFFFAIFLFFANAMPNVQMFPIEAAVFLRENTNNWYSLGSYYITKVVSDLPMQIICPTSFLLISYYMTGQPLEPDRFFKVWIISLLLTMLAQLFGIAAGAAFNTHAGMFLVPAFNIPMLLFAGFFLKLDQVPSYLRFFTNISYFRYAFEGLVQGVYSERSKLPCTIDYCHLRNPEKILSELDMPSVTFQFILLALISWIVTLHLLIYGVLRLKLYSARR